MVNVYCKYCGHTSSTIAILTSQPCTKHPNGNNKGRHALYEGSEKSRYNCKYCGHTSPTIAILTSQPCTKHPNGNNKGSHEPAL